MYTCENCGNFFADEDGYNYDYCSYRCYREAGNSPGRQDVRGSSTGCCRHD